MEKRNLTLCKRYQCWDCGNPMKQCTSISCLWKKCSKCRKKNYLLQYAHPFSVMEEIRSQGKFLTRNCVKEICQDFQSSWPLQIRWWAIYISHILRSRQWSYQTPGGPSAKGRWELWVASKTMQTDCSSEANWLIMEDYKKH